MICVILVIPLAVVRGAEAAGLRESMAAWVLFLHLDTAGVHPVLAILGGAAVRRHPDRFIKLSLVTLRCFRNATLRCRKRGFVAAH